MVTPTSTGAPPLAKFPAVPLTEGRPSTLPSSTDAGFYWPLRCGICMMRRGDGDLLGTLYKTAGGTLEFAAATAATRGEARRTGAHPYGVRTPVADGIKVRCRNGHEYRVSGLRLAARVAAAEPRRAIHLFE